ncbi:Putative adhesin [Candidatus Kryptobacter tengchongensis]|nr:Putative adhesin [Candidatus Kryptobacter tengchongensis]CUU10926.1 Putative adhesin [Candidatus Kryptobacter tengchongensis]
MKPKFLIFIITGFIFAGGLLLCSNIKTREITPQNSLQTADELKFSKSFKANPGYKLYIESDVSDVIIQSHSSNEINLNFYVRGSQERLKELNISFEEGENSLTIKIKRKKKIPWFDFSELFLFGRKWVEMAQLVVNAPDSLSDLTVKSTGGDIKIENFKSNNFDLSSAGGDIHAKDLRGRTYASSAGGDIRLRNCAGSGEIKTAGGDIIVSEYQGELEAKSSGGDITINKLTGSVSASSSGGDINVEFILASGITRLSSSGGDVKIYAPSNLNAYIDFKTSGGDIKVDFPIKIETKSHSELKGWIGKSNSGTTIKASTSGGDIELISKDLEI